METSETRRGRADAGLETWSIGSARETWAAPALLRLLVIAVGGYLYGYVTPRLPAPDTGARFWLGNLAAPYLLIPFLAGAWRFRAVAASAAGALGAAAAVASFYDFLWVGDVTNLDLDRTSSSGPTSS